MGTGGYDASCAEPLDRLRDSGDVVRHGRHTRTEGLEERAALIELRPVGKEGEGRLAECALELVLREVAEPPFGQVTGLGAVAVHRLHWITRDEQARAGDLFCRRNRISEPLVGPDRAEAEQRVSVVRTLWIAGEYWMRNDGRVDAELGEAFPSVLAVNDDTVETGEQGLPEPLLPRRPPRQQIVSREHGRHARAQQDPIQLGRREPLHVQDIGTAKQFYAETQGSAAPAINGVEAHFAGGKEAMLTIEGKSERLLMADPGGRIIVTREMANENPGAVLAFSRAPAFVVPYSDEKK